MATHEDVVGTVVDVTYGTPAGIATVTGVLESATDDELVVAGHVVRSLDVIELAESDEPAADAPAGTDGAVDDGKVRALDVLGDRTPVRLMRDGSVGLPDYDNGGWIRTDAEGLVAYAATRAGTLREAVRVLKVDADHVEALARQDATSVSDAAASLYATRLAASLVDRLRHVDADMADAEAARVRRGAVSTALIDRLLRRIARG